MGMASFTYRQRKLMLFLLTETNWAFWPGLRPCEAGVRLSPLPSLSLSCHFASSAWLWLRISHLSTKFSAGCVTRISYPPYRVLNGISSCKTRHSSIKMIISVYMRKLRSYHIAFMKMCWQISSTPVRLLRDGFYKMSRTSAYVR